MRISWRQEEQWEKGTKWRVDWLYQESPFGIISEIFAYLWRTKTFGFIKKDPHEETTQRQLEKKHTCDKQCIITTNPSFDIHISKETDSGVVSFCKITTYCRQTSVEFSSDYWLCLAKLQYPPTKSRWVVAKQLLPSQTIFDLKIKWWPAAKVTFFKS